MPNIDFSKTQELKCSPTELTAWAKGPNPTQPLEKITSQTGQAWLFNRIKQVMPVLARCKHRNFELMKCRELTISSIVVELYTNQLNFFRLRSTGTAI